MNLRIFRGIHYLFFVFLVLPSISAFGEEKILRLLVWEGYAPQKYVEKFEKEIVAKYNRNVKMTISYAESSDDFYNAILNKEVDMVTLSHHSIKDKRLNYIEKGLIIPPDLENISNYKYLIKELKTANYHINNGILYSIPVANGPYGLVYNTKIFKKAPQSWNIFWDPKFKKKYIIGANEYLYNVNIAALALGYSVDSINNFDILNNDKLKQKLRQLAVNAHYLWIGVDKPDDYMGMSLGASWGDALTSLERRGEIWEMADPKEGTLWWIDDYAITGELADKPFMKKVAEEWINKVLLSVFQVDHIIREVGIYPVVTNIVDELTEKEKEKIQPESFDFFMEKRILQQTHSQRNRNGMKLLWEEAMKGISIKGHN